MSSARPSRRFSGRVFLLAVEMLLVISGVLTVYFVQAQLRMMESAVADRGRALAGLLAADARTAVFTENAALTQETLAAVAGQRDVLSAAVFSIDGTFVAAQGRGLALHDAAGRLGPGDLAVLPLLRPESGCLDRPGEKSLDAYCPVLLRQLGVSAEEIYYEDQQVGAGQTIIGVARVTIDREPLRRRIRQQLLRSLAFLLVILVLGGWAGYRFARRVSEPLERLTDAVHAFAAGADIGKLAGMPDNEIGKLAEAFTAMTRDLAQRELEKEALAERLRHAQKMEAVGRLSQGVSHDFKNILSTLKTAVHILQKGSPDNPFVLSYAGRMEVTLGRARELVERLLAFSRPRDLELGPVDLPARLRRLEPAVREAVGEHVRLNLELPGGPLFVHGDAASLDQLFMNLVYNARDAMPAGGILCVRLDLSEAAAGGPRLARLSVRDTGAGMEPEVLRRLFEPFFTTKEPGMGMGLGLSIVHGIVEDHRGLIRVESEPGEGTAVVVELPLSEETESATAARGAGGGDGGAATGRQA